MLTFVSTITNPKAALERAIEVAGSIRRLAAAINAHGTACPDNAPAMWKKRGRVPAEYCPAIEAGTGVACEALRPDVPWQVLRGKRRHRINPAAPAAATARPAA